MERITHKEPNRYSKERRVLTFEKILASDVATIFTPKQQDLLRLYRDGKEGEFAQHLNVTQNTMHRMKGDIADRMHMSFGKSPGKSSFVRALGISILAGWIEPRDFSVKEEPIDLEIKIVDLLLYGFNMSESEKVLSMTREGYKQRLDNIKAKLDVVTNEEVVAWQASTLRRMLLALREANV